MVATSAPNKTTISLPNVVTVRKFAEVTNLPVTKVIGTLLALGVKATINESIDFETAQVLADEFGFELKPETQAGVATTKPSKHSKPRAPIVTIMGHVDHGKTQLLDSIRKTNVVAQESGGITQHIGACQVHAHGRDITFLDTPGHEAFSALRAHGANITDIIVMVIAANEGIKPQTLEAISHAKAANVPIVVAINKIDLPEADVEKVKRQLAEQNLLPEDYGGNIPTVLVSAKTGQGIQELLDMILLVSDMRELTADPKVSAQGVIVESHVEPGIGPVATCLVIQGTLAPGQIITIGSTWGKIRTMTDWTGAKLKAAAPATPVQISGLKALPHFADLFQVVESESQAKALAAQRLRTHVVHRVSKGLAERSQAIAEGSVAELKLIIKADVVGSLEALKQSVGQIHVPGVTLTIIQQSVGQVSESDVNLADASGAVILAFRSSVSQPVAKLAEQKGIEIKQYQVIYQLIDELKGAATGKLKPEIVETPVGTFTVVKSFFQIKDEAIIGGTVDKGIVVPNIEARVLRRDKVIGNVKISALKQGDATVTEAKSGGAFGLKVLKTGEQFRIRPGDTLDCYKTEKKLRSHEPNSDTA
ncbi:translation initiation factor IF-2 [Candidatus Berkelbacteria bacterium]|nr:translation initiation factor IF-2 [Candidatus Berkelbacteria bacterium]